MSSFPGLGYWWRNNNVLAFLKILFAVNQVVDAVNHTLNELNLKGNVKKIGFNHWLHVKSIFTFYKHIEKRFLFTVALFLTTNIEVLY